MAAAKSAAFVLGGEFHDRISGKNSITPEEHEKNVLILSKLAKKLKVTYIYYLVEENNNFFFTATSATDEELASHTFDPFFYPYPEASAKMRKALEEVMPLYEEYQDKYGFFRSLYYPRISPKGKKYLIGVDILMETINSHLKQLLLEFILAGFAVFLLILVGIFPLLTRLSSHLQRLSDFATELVHTKFLPSQDVLNGIENLSKTHQDEVGKISSSLLFMYQALQKHIQELKTTISAKEKFESELRIAHQIQLGILPKDFPPFPGCSRVKIDAVLKSAKEVGGDFYDFFFLESGKLFFAIGDVSGKGIPASFFMAMTIMLLRTTARKNSNPCEILEIVNNDLFHDNDSSMFVTVFSGVIDLSSGAGEYAIAGHNPPYLLKGTEIQPLPTGGTALGVIRQPSIVSGKFELKQGESIFLFTDGITEAQNPEEKFFGEERLEKFLAENIGQPPEKVVRKTLAVVSEFRQGTPLADDMTIFVVQFAPSEVFPKPKEPCLKLCVQNQISELKKIRIEVETFLGERGHSKEIVSEVFLIIDELVSNIIYHGTKNLGPSLIDIVLWEENGKFQIIVQDEGIPFNPVFAPSPPLVSSLEDRPLGGLGIHLVKKLSEKLVYDRIKDKNFTWVTKPFGALSRTDSGFLKTSTGKFEEKSYHDLKFGGKMEISEEKIDDFSVIRLKGRIDANTAPSLDAALNAVIDRGEQKVILSCDELEYINSTGLRTLLAASKKLQTSKGKLILTGITPPIRKIFQITGFTTIFSIFENIQEAQKNFEDL